MNFLKRIGLPLLLMGFVVGLFSCSGKKEAGAPAASQAQAASGKAYAGKTIDPSKKLRVGFTLQDLTNTYYIDLARGVTDRQDKFNLALTVHDGKSDAASQVTAIENFVTQGVDCIVINPIDSIVPEAAVRDAHSAGIPVISWSEYVRGSEWFLALNQHDYGVTGGEIAGKWAAERFTNQADAKVMFLYVPDNVLLAERGQGLKDGFFQYCPGGVQVAEQSGRSPEDGMRAVEATLIQHPDLNVVVCWNDTVALGAYEAMLAAGKKPGDACIVGLDATAPALEKIYDKTIFVGTSDVDAYGQGEYFIQMVMDIIENGSKDDPEGDPFWVYFKPVSKDNIQEYKNNGRF
jgi:ABC-type sugar transport system substrate-binding protein